MTAGPSAVDLYVTDPASCARPEIVARTLSLLTDEERRRHDSFRFDIHRSEYLATRALVLSVLAAFTESDAGALRFTRNEYGCPRLASHPGLEFNLTNSTTLVACLVSRCGPVGVDVEPIARADDILEIADTVFAPSELAALRALAALADRRQQALDLWTLKESYIKARGMGLALPLDQFAFGFAPPAPPSLAVDPRLADRGDRWAFSLRDEQGHRIAACVEATPSRALDEGPPVVRVHRVIPFVEPITTG